MCGMIHYSLDGIESNPYSVVTVGAFDGLHVAHRKILDTLVEKTKSLALHIGSSEARSVLITFTPHPQEVLGKKIGNPLRGKVEMLMTDEERVQMISDAGINEICLLKFDHDFSLVTAEDFLVKLIYKGIGLHELVLGYNHTFGHKAQGTVEFAREVGKKIGFNVDFVDKILIEGMIVSSSKIRKLLKDGNLLLANKMLGRQYSFDGFVIRGDGRGRLLGYPTANLRLVDERLLVPSFGVYVVEVTVPQDEFSTGAEKFIGLARLGCDRLSKTQMSRPLKYGFRISTEIFTGSGSTFH